jgi:hypothetical protein
VSLVPHPLRPSWNPVDVLRHRIARDALSVRDTIRAAALPIPLAAAAASVCTLIAHLTDGEHG